MKQISKDQALALAIKNHLKDEIRYCQADWIRENARHIADIETKRADRTFYGQWPKGWKNQMVKDSTEAAKEALLARFLRDECKVLDGAIWLGNWEMIQSMEKK